MPLSSLPLLITFSLCAIPLSLSSSPTPPPDLRFIKSIPLSLRQNASQEYIELARPLPSDHLTPSCSLLVFHHIFGDTIGRPPVSAGYSPPSGCPPPWSHVVLEMHVSSKGDQYDRIAGVWLGGAEILRTSTAEPTEDGIFWKVRKDITRYTFLLQSSNLTLTVMLENVVNDDFTGLYNVTLIVLYYKSNSIRVPSSIIVDHKKLSRDVGFEPDLVGVSKEAVGSVDKQRNPLNVYESPEDHIESSRKLGLTKDLNALYLKLSDGELGFESEKLENNQVTLNKEEVDKVNEQGNLLNFYEAPADLIVPISDVGDGGFWFRIESESGIGSRGIRIPPNTRKAVLELYVSFHGNDEFWYQNPPDSYIIMNNLTTGRGHGSYREVFVQVDGHYIGSVIPFPVIFTGGINPLFWEPVVSIGAFNLPSYDFDLTPFLGRLLDEKVHSFGFGVSDSIPFWLLDANLHLWLDHNSSAVQAKVVASRSPAVSIKRSSRFELLDGSFKINAKRKCQFSGWVYSSAGNFTTHVVQLFMFSNSIRFKKNGTLKVVQQRVKTTTQLNIKSEAGSLVWRAVLRRQYPLKVITSTIPRSETVYMMVTNVSHSMKEKSSFGGLVSSLYNVQDSEGWMVVKDHSVLLGSASTNQSFSSKNEFGQYSRIVSATDGRLIVDNVTLYHSSSY